MKLLTLALLLCIGAAAQTIDEAHALLARVKALGLSTLTRNDAEPLLRKAAKIWEAKDPQNPEYAQVLVLLGMIRYSRHPTTDTEGMRKDVEPLYCQAVDIYSQNAASADPSDVALALEAEADVLIKIGSSAESKPLKERAVDIRKKHIEDLQKDAPAGPSEGLRIGGGVAAPVVVSKIEPSYSEVARFNKQQGTVVFGLVVGADGVPYRLRLVRGPGFGLDEAAFRAVSRWRFRPATRDGQPVPVIATIEVNFRLL